MKQTRQQTAGSARTFWRVLRHLRSTAPTIWSSLLFLLAVEVIAVVVLPSIISPCWYLRQYLPEASVESMRQFAADRHEFMIPDEVVGWHNRPDVTHAQWQTDNWGGRATHALDTIPKRPVRVLFLGSSLINGGLNVTNDQTVAAYVEDSVTEALNFGIMLFAFDQVYLDYTHWLHRFAPNVIVVALSEDPETGLTNRYVPFRSWQESIMPFVKPRFVAHSRELSLLPAPPLDEYPTILNNDSLLDELCRTDGYAENFTQFRRFGMTPLAAAGLYFYRRIGNACALVSTDREERMLLKQLMHRFNREGARTGARVVYLVLPRIESVAPGGWRQFLPDHFGLLVDDLKSEGFDVLDARPVFRTYDKPLSSLYFWDGFHFSANGNQLIAGALKEHLARSTVRSASL